MTLASKKRQRVGSSSRLSSFCEEKLNILKNEENERQFSSNNIGGFNDATSADVVLTLQRISTSFDKDQEEKVEVEQSAVVYLHSNVLKECRYFAALLSERWQTSLDNKMEKPIQINLSVPDSRTMETYYILLQLFYSKDFSGIIKDVPSATALLPIASELLYDDCISYCVRFLEAVPWTEEEEREVVKLVPFLQQGEAAELLARISPVKGSALEDMLNGLIFTATHSHLNGATVKAFVAKLLRDYSSRDAVRLVLDNAFATSLKSVKDSLEEFSSPNLRGGDHDEIEAMQRMNLHTAVVNGRHLLWLIERMIELKVADTAVKEWSEQATFAANLHRTFRDDAWRNIAPGLPALVLRCTCRLANAVASGSILAQREVRMKLVKDWLPVVIACKDNVSPIPSSQKFLYQELEDVFLQIISTLPMLDAQGLLQQCLNLATRNVDDCTHLVSAFNTWFRRASHAPYLFGDD